ncbi:hypothetical protein BH10CYA1_BH10CYA1_03780 [soil metagenome]
MSAFRPPRQSLPKFTDRLSLGTQGLTVSPFCLGMTGSPSVVSTAFDAGINFFFITTDMHWPLYEQVRQGLKDLLRRPGVRDEIVVAAVCYPTQPEFCSMPFTEVLNEIPELERIDLLIAGGAYAVEFADRQPIYEQHRQSAFAGAKAIGATFHDRKAAVSAVKANNVDIAYIRYNPGHPGARKDVFPKLTTSPTLLFNFKSTMSFVPSAELEALGMSEDDYWHPAITDHYRFALSSPELDGLLISMKTPQEIEALSAALEHGPLDADEEQCLMDISLLVNGAAKIDRK